MFTKLEAVNLILEAIGEDPVSSLTSGLPDAASAERILDRVTKEELQRGWHCNTDDDYTLNVDANNNILVPDDTLRVDTVGGDKHRDLVIRRDPNDDKRKLYDRKNHTYTFTGVSSVKVQIIWDMDFEDLTSALQAWIAHHSARKFQESEQGSISADAFTLRNEQEAWDSLQGEELENRDNNVLRQSPHAYKISYRPSRGYLSY